MKRSEVKKQLMNWKKEDLVVLMADVIDELNWFSVLLDDCGSDEPYKEEIMDLGQPKTEEELQNILEENWLLHKKRTNKIIEKYKEDLEIEIRNKIKYEQSTQQNNDFTKKYIEKYTKINEENGDLPF